MLVNAPATSPLTVRVKLPQPSSSEKAISILPISAAATETPLSVPFTETASEPSSCLVKTTSLVVFSSLLMENCEDSMATVNESKFEFTNPSVRLK